MKEINKIQKELVQNVNMEQEKKQSFFGSIKLNKGNTLFEINTQTKKISEASFESEPITINTKGCKPIAHNKKVVMNPKCVYIAALNKKNAIKKFSKMIDIINK